MTNETTLPSRVPSPEPDTAPVLLDMPSGDPDTYLNELVSPQYLLEAD